MEWNLEVIKDDRATEENISKLVEKLLSYKGRIESLSASELAAFIELNQEYGILFGVFRQYAGLRTAADANDKEALEMVNHNTNVSTNWGKQLAFIGLELGKLLNDRPELLSADELQKFNYYLQRQQQSYKYRLSEIEEMTFIEKDRFGVSEWGRLQGELVSKTKYEIEMNGEKKEYSWSEGYGLISHKDHTIRKAAVVGLGKGLQKNEDIFAFSFRNLAGNFLMMNKKRGYGSYIESSLFSSHLDKEIIDTMFEVLLANRDVLQKYLLLKAKLLGTEKLRGEDLFAPFPFSDDRTIPWDDAKKTVVEGFSEFHPEFGAIAQEMFENNRVDALPRPGKRAGAFCSTWYPGKSAFIMMSYNDNMSSLGTLAHEMGHAVHAWYITREQPPVHSGMGMSLAETASEFGSLLFNLKFMREAENETSKKSILFNMVEHFLIVMYEVGSRKLFEQKVYEALDNNQFLDAGKINSLYREALDEMFGDAVEWLPEQMYHWCWKPHYYSAGLRFYNYPYVFGEFSVLGMYAKYREDPAKFTEGYRSYLKAGGSNLPKVMFKELFGFELDKSSFWQNGIDELKNFVKQCESMLT